MCPFLLRLGGFFNWYREDSEVLYPYGWISNKGKSPPKEPKETWLKPHPTSSRLVAKVKALGHRKPVAWLVSNCHTSSQRELYVKELQKYVPVDIFGRCGKPLKCTVERDECFKEIQEQYQFYLSFENSLCKDYATEKLYRALASNLVPVVMVGANYSKIVPPRSEPYLFKLLVPNTYWLKIVPFLLGQSSIPKILPRQSF